MKYKISNISIYPFILIQQLILPKKLFVQFTTFKNMRKNAPFKKCVFLIIITKQKSSFIEIRGV